MPIQVQIRPEDIAAADQNMALPQNPYDDLTYAILGQVPPDRIERLRRRYRGSEGGGASIAEEMSMKAMADRDQVLRSLEGLAKLQELRSAPQRQQVDMLQKLAAVSGATGIPLDRLMRGDFSTGAGMSGQVPQEEGLPPPPSMAAFAGMSKSAQDALRQKMAVSAEKDLIAEEKAGTAAGKMGTDAERFLQINRETPTGGVYALPGIEQALRMFSPARQEMEALRNQVAPMMRQLGSGAVSDWEQRMFQRATIGPQNSLEANENIGQAIIASAKRNKDRMNFLQSYVDAYGTMRGADAAWAKYMEAEPLFDPHAAERGEVRYNQNRRTWKQFFGEGGKGEGKGPRPPLSSFRRGSTSPVSQESYAGSSQPNVVAAFGLRG